MDLTAIFTDDQLGILGCFVALGACGLMAAITFHTGPGGKNSLTESEGARTIPARKPKIPAPAQEGRRAA